MEDEGYTGVAHYGEAWAEAYAAYKLGHRQILPDYIVEFMEKRMGVKPPKKS